MIIATTTVKTTIIMFLQRVSGGYALVYDPHILLLCRLLLFKHKVIFYCIEIYCNKPIIVRERERLLLLSYFYCTFYYCIKRSAAVLLKCIRIFPCVDVLIFF